MDGLFASFLLSDLSLSLYLWCTNDLHLLQKEEKTVGGEGVVRFASVIGFVMENAPSY